MLCNNRFYIFSTVFIFFLSISLSGFSQRSSAVEVRPSDYQRGMEYFKREKYVPAINFFDTFLKDSRYFDLHIERANAEYYAAMAAVILGNRDAEARVLRFVEDNSDFAKLNDCYLQLGNMFYDKDEYIKAIEYYDRTNRQMLSGDTLAQYMFQMGYANYRVGDYSRALLFFSEIKDSNNEYSASATYYFAYIAYQRQRYVTAEEEFQKLQNDRTYGDIVAYYLVQIKYLHGDYDYVIRECPALINAATAERRREMCGLIGDSYYRKENYTEALRYLKQYFDNNESDDREKEYQLAYCYYKIGDIDNAIKTLSTITRDDDPLSQNVSYLLGDCYLKIGNIQRAQFCFKEASQWNFDREIKREALFNYAKTSYELSYSPLGESMTALQNYIETYPTAENIQEAYNYLVAEYVQAKNYQAALVSLDKISNKNEIMKGAYQKVAYYRGLELFNNLLFEEAIEMFDKSLSYQEYDMLIRAGAIYWRGEAYYRLNDFVRAQADYSDFMGIPGATSMDEYALVRYNLGSALYNQQRYSDALTHFRNFESTAVLVGVDANVIADARNRIADCYYVNTDYASAISYYDKVIAYGKTDADYASYRKAFSLGLMNNQRQKIEVLTELIGSYPQSSYIPSAYFERGRAYIALGNTNSAENDFKTIIDRYSTNQLVPSAIVQLGLLYYNMGDNAKTIEQYKLVVEGYRSTEEGRFAMNSLRNIYAEMNDIESYFDYAKNIQGYDNISSLERDSLLYRQVENLFVEGSYDRATAAATSYLNEFPNGIFYLNAKYYLAESLNESYNFSEALSAYGEIIDMPDNQYTIQSLLRASKLAENQEDYELAYNYYSQLDAVAADNDMRITALQGRLNSAYELADTELIFATANDIIAASNVPEELSRRAIYLNAMINYSLGNLDVAIEGFNRVAGEVVSAEGAEAKYRVAEIYYKTNQIDRAEQTTTEFINMSSPQQYWTGKILILISDISRDKGDLLQAKVTLESLRDYYTIEDDGILEEVKMKLNQLTTEN